MRMLLLQADRLSYWVANGLGGSEAVLRAWLLC